MQRKYDVCFQRKNEQSRANVEIAPYLLPHCLWYKCILSPHIFCARKFFTNVFFHITFACTNKRLVKAAITAVAPIVNTVLNMKFALKQTWSKLRKCGLYAIFATHLLPAKIHFFVQCIRLIHLHVCKIIRHDLPKHCAIIRHDLQSTVPISQQFLSKIPVWNK